jgi:RNA polymerase sigma-70 factor (ECF subfamily)
VVLEADVLDVAGAAVDPAVTAIRIVDLQRALTALGSGREGAARRELARLVFVEDRPLADVAARLGVPKGTVKSRLFKVRRLLRAAPGNNDYGSGGGM